ncbi:DUF6314 family protein [Falsihalocynthiibacter sp. SS001]|uniref:DUF6314 family protein n=1 Tax=Falsihalocynthiibacter sp. SS001 TaxID=3349698 RepID=UPI0036D421B4
MVFSPELADFRGEWILNRQITSDIAGQSGEFEGRAIFAPHPDGLAYHEAGKLRMAGGGTLQAERRYLWREVNGQIEVLFEDGRAFHKFGDNSATHYCDPDIYRVTYDFTEWPRWTSAWRVTGPRKDYVMTSAYAPVPS